MAQRYAAIVRDKRSPIRLVFWSCLAGCLVASGTVAAADAGLKFRKTFPSCKELNVKYPHGIGLPGAVDKVQDNTEPVTNFLVDANRYYLLWAGSKKGLAKGQKYGGSYDADEDGIGCEKL
jgi:hypothetical protein